MNLRVDAHVIRIRVSHAEAQRLDTSGKLSERLALPGLAVNLRTFSGSSGHETLQSSFNGSFEVGISTSALKRILVQAEINSKPSKDELQVTGHLQGVAIGNEPVEVRFEVDRFTIHRV